MAKESVKKRVERLLSKSKDARINSGNNEYFYFRYLELWHDLEDQLENTVIAPFDFLLAIAKDSSIPSISTVSRAKRTILNKEGKFSDSASTQQTVPQSNKQGHPPLYDPIT